MSRPICNSMYAFLAIAATVPMVAGGSGPPASSDTERKANDFTAPPDKSLVYVYRSKSLFGAAVPMRVTLDSSQGFIGPGGFLVKAVEPGTHAVLIEMPPPNVSKITAMLAPPKPPTPANVSFDTKPGATYFLHAIPEMGFSANKISQRLEPPEIAEKALAGSHQVEWTTEGLVPAQALEKLPATSPGSVGDSAPGIEHGERASAGDVPKQ